jgi:hypothetical protein
MPQGTEEGTELRLPQTFTLLVNRPARFRLLTSTERPGDRVGDLVPIEGLAELPPIFAALRLEGTSRDQTLPVELCATLTEIGTLAIECVVPESGRRWKLAFDLRAKETAPGEGAAPTSEKEAPLDFAPAQDIIRRTFAPAPDGPKVTPDRVIKELEAALGTSRENWTLPALRALWEPLRDLRGERGKTVALEARWLNLAGFCLRPGFGYELDDWRIKEIWRVWNAGLVNDGNEACRLSWWILWRRVSGGLGRTQQDELAKRIAPHLTAPPGTRPGGRKPPGPQEAAEMWRTVASLERIAPELKEKLGEALLPRVEKIGIAGWFAIGRLGARVPLCGPVGGVVPRKTAEQWLERLLLLDWKSGAEHAAFAVAEIARCAGDRARDLGDTLRARVADRVKAAAGGERLVEMILSPVVLEAREERFAFGEALPTGLRLADLPREGGVDVGETAP